MFPCVTEARTSHLRKEIMSGKEIGYTAAGFAGIMGTALVAISLLIRHAYLRASNHFSERID